MLSVGDYNNGTAHRDVNASRCLAQADLSSEEMKPVLCSAEFLFKKNDWAIWESFMETYLSG